MTITNVRTVIGINANDYYFLRRAWKKRGRSIPKGEQKPVTFSIWRAKDSVNKDGVVSTVGDSILDEVLFPSFFVSISLQSMADQ